MSSALLLNWECSHGRRVVLHIFGEQVAIEDGETKKLVIKNGEWTIESEESFSPGHGKE